MTTIITKANMSEFVISGEFDIPSTTEGLSVTLRFKMDKTPVSEVVQSSLKDKRINKQIGLREHASEYKSGQIVTVDYKGGRTTVDPESAMAAKLAAMSDTERAAYLLAKFGLVVASK
jgi:hypothetical protein